jgi:hypothetical protein
MGARLPSIEAIGRDTPLRLSVAAALAFPDGSMTASGLRPEGARLQLMGEYMLGHRPVGVGHALTMARLAIIPFGSWSPRMPASLVPTAQARAE